MTIDDIWGKAHFNSLYHFIKLISQNSTTNKYYQLNTTSDPRISLHLCNWYTSAADLSWYYTWGCTQGCEKGGIEERKFFFKSSSQASCLWQHSQLEMPRWSRWKDWGHQNKTKQYWQGFKCFLELHCMYLFLSLARANNTLLLPAVFNCGAFPWMARFAAKMSAPQSMSARTLTWRNDVPLIFTSWCPFTELKRKDSSHK